MPLKRLCGDLKRYTTAHLTSTSGERFSFLIYMIIIRQVLLKNFKRRLIDCQIDVYLSWARRSNKWDLGGDRAWLETLVNVTNLRDIQDIDEACLDKYMEHVKTIYGNGYLATSAQKSVCRFVRFFMARTKGFTNNPRYVMVSNTTTYPQKGVDKGSVL